MNTYQKIKVAFFTFFAVIAIIAVLIEYSVFRKVHHNYDYGKERELLAKKIPENKLSQVNIYKQKYFNKSNIIRSRFELQENLIMQANVLKDDLTASIVEYHKIINDQFELYKECNKTLSTIFNPEELAFYKSNDSFCYFRR